MEASRPGAGDKVLILSTENTRFFLPSRIGQECVIQTDEKDFHPYQVNGCSAWLFEADVKIQPVVDDEMKYQRVVSFSPSCGLADMSPLADAEEEAEFGHTMTEDDGQDLSDAEDDYFGGGGDTTNRSAAEAEFGITEEQLMAAERSLNRLYSVASDCGKEELERRRSVRAAAAEALAHESPSAAAPCGDLVENSEGCPCFAPNPFKKIKCKNCGCPWKEHLGVISEELLQGFLK